MHRAVRRDVDGCADRQTRRCRIPGFSVHRGIRYHERTGGEAVLISGGASSDYAGRMQPGQTLDARFELESLVGSGGMADVYRARELVTGKRVALKILRMSQHAGIARFRREGSVLARMQHPHIVRYVAHGAGREATWLAMEWLEGESLEARLARGPLTVGECVAVARNPYAVQHRAVDSAPVERHRARRLRSADW